MGKKRKLTRAEIRKVRVRRRLTTGTDRPRLAVFRSNRHLYAQIIDDLSHRTIVAASTKSKELKGKVEKTTTMSAAKEVGLLIAKKAQEKNVKKVCFDRRSYLYHGRVKALADAARSGGLQF
ncbi:MAG: 50S ribosomal protein L18 [Pseudomonadota bacterium]